MSTHSGNSGKVKISAVTIAEVTGFSMEIENAMIEDSALTDAADTFIAGSYRWSGEVTCWWDETDSTGQQALIPGASVTLNLQPEGDGSGASYYSGTALVQTISRVVRRNQTVEVTFRFQGSGVNTPSTL